MATPVALPTLPIEGTERRESGVSLTDEEKNTTSPGSASIVSKSESDTSSWLAPSVFDDEATAKLYEPPANYEGAHRFDIKARWTKEEDAAVVRKCDIYLFSFVCICFFGLQLDRANITFALSDNMLNDLGLTTNQYNTGQTLFYLCFLSMELPSQLISKWLGVDVWVPIQMIGWSLVSISQCRITGVKTFYATRALLGALEGGFIPDMILYLSYSYSAAELTTRLSWFWITLSGTNIVGAFLAAAIIPLGGKAGMEGWRWLFLIEGLITLLIGMFALVWLPPSPTQTASWFRGKAGWFTEREETIITMRVLRDDPTKSSMHNREPIGFKELWQSLTDFDHLPLYALGLTTYIPAATVNAYFTLVLRSLGFSTFASNMLQIPHYALFMFNNWLISSISRRVNERSIVASFAGWWQMLFLIVLVAIPNDTAQWSKYAILTLLVAYPYCHPILVSWNSQNSGSVRTRSVSASVYNMTVQASSIIASNIYREEDKPYYRRGNRILLGIVSVNLVLFAFAKVYYILRNKSRTKQWEAMSAGEREAYLVKTPPSNRRLDFRFVH